MRLTVDTNLLVRMAVRDDDAQARTALKILAQTERIILPLPCILELVWILSSVYGLSRAEIAGAVNVLIEAENVVTEVAAIEAGLRVLLAGGDFADGVIASAGAGMGANAFVSFDNKALRQITELGLVAFHASTLA